MGLTLDDPPFLYHYTSIPVLESIIRKPVMRCSDYRFLNDESEFEYGLKLIERVAMAIRAETEQTSFDQFWREVTVLARDRLPYLHPFVFCFTTKADDLNQWRSYSDERGRVALGFRTESIVADPARGKRWKLTNIVYETQNHERFVRGVIEAFFRDYREATRSEKDELVRQTFIHSLESAMSCKHHKFSEEKEWRLFSKLEAGFPIEFRTSKYGFTPFLEIDLPIEWLAHVYIGPSIYRDLQVASVEAFIKCHGLDVRVIPTEIPYRI